MTTEQTNEQESEEYYVFAVPDGWHQEEEDDEDLELVYNILSPQERQAALAGEQEGEGGA